MARWLPTVALEQQQAAGAEGGIELSPGERAWVAAHPIVRVAGDGSAAPIEFVNEAGRFEDRKSVVEGKSVSVRVDLGGRSIIKNTNISKQTKDYKRYKHEIN